MYIVAIAWIFVAALASLGAESIIGGLLTFTGFTLPLLLLLWLLGSPMRRRKRVIREQAEALQQDGEANSQSSPESR